MYILDTDVLGFYLNKPDNYQHLTRHIEDADSRGLLCTNIITVEEVLAGKLSHLNTVRQMRPRNEELLLEAYRYLLEFMLDIRRFLILPFDKAASDVFQAFPNNIKEHSVNDCRIAAIAYSRDYTVITNNGTDFNRIKAATQVKVEYWVNAPLPS